MAKIGRPRQSEKLAQAKLDAEALDLLAEGMTIRQAAAVQGVTPSTIHARYRRALALVPVQSAEEYRRIWLDRLELQYRAALRVQTTPHLTVSNGNLIIDPRTGDPLLDDAPVLQATVAIVRIAERVARITGFDAPTKSAVTITTEDVVDAEIRRLEAELADRSTAGEAASA